MYNPSTSWREQIKNVIQEMNKQNLYALDGVVTSVNNTLPYTVKVRLEPYQIETGWLPISSSYVGNGYGIVLPPPAEGNHVKVIFSMGDINSGFVVGSTYNNTTAPPQVNFGDAGIFHKSGSSIVMKNDGSIVITSKGGGSIVLDGSDKKVTINGNSQWEF